MTLMEVLVAMLVLLVGIYTVARGFPMMLQSIRGEGDRTSMARLAENTMSRLADNQAGLPEAITGGGSVSQYSFASDMTAPHVEQNAQEDIYEVRGEAFRVPAPYRSPGGSYTGSPGWYALSQGPAKWTSGYPYVYLLVPLHERQDEAPIVGGVANPSFTNTGGNWFYVNKEDGQIITPATVTTSEGSNTRNWTVTSVVCDYAWTTSPSGSPPYAPPVAHYVQGETPACVVNFPTSGTPDFRVATVHAAHGTGGAHDGSARLVLGQTRAWAKIEFGRNIGIATPPPGQFSIEPKYGATLAFNPQDAGLTLKVDYQLRTTQGVDDNFPRRLLLMHEEQTIQPAVTREDAGVPFGDVRLALKQVDDEPIFTTDVQGNPYDAATAPVHVLAIDLSTGQPYTDWSGFSLYDENLNPPLESGYQDGILTLPLQIGGVPAPYLGHVWRFYYRTLDRNNIQVQKAPRAYVDADTARKYLGGFLHSPTPEVAEASRADVDYRTYVLNHVAAPGSGTLRMGVIEFGQWLSDGTFTQAESSSGFTVAVNYAYWRNATDRRVVYGELHTIPAMATSFVLNHATIDASHPIEVMGVNGVSARARAWWLARNGRQRQLDVETVFLTNALGLLPTVQ
ncbi:MAG: hypothetical protein ACYC63_11185 [Armatimonadota bacterium]